MRRRPVLVSGGLLIATAMGCQVIAGLGDHPLASDLSDASSDALFSGDETTPGFTIAALPSLAILPGSTGSEPITITRVGGFSDPVAFAVIGLPSGVTADPLQIAANQTTGSLTFHVAASNDQSASPLTVSAVAAGAVGTAIMNFYVRGPVGTPDLTFASKGEVIATGVIPTDGALDAANDVIVAGVDGTSAGIFESIRILTSGVVDGKFGDISQTFVQPALGFRVFPLLTEDLLYAGSLSTGAEYFRVSAAGAFDKSFSPDGGIGFYDVNSFSVFAVDSSGQTYSAGNVNVAARANLFIQRRDASGAIDSTYGGTYPIGADNETVTDAIVQPDGKLVTACNALLNTNPFVAPAFALNRFNATGTLDNAFGVAGYVAPKNSSSSGRLALAPDGSIYVLALNGGLMPAALYHFSSAGVLDAAFGGSGELSVPGSAALAVQADGKIVLLGGVTLENSSDSGTYMVMQVERVTAAGVVDVAFGTHGFVQTILTDADGSDPKSGGTEVPVAVRIQDDGRIVVIGQLLGDGQDATDHVNGVVVDRFWN